MTNTRGKKDTSTPPSTLDSKVSNSIYAGTYEAFRLAMRKTLLPHITTLGNGIDNVFLTDHGIEHIDQLILRANELCMQGKIDLTDYEGYILLIAIHIHDIGNALGRRGHTTKIDEVLQKLYGPLGFNHFDKLLAEQIASVHGGQIYGSDDTLAILQSEHTVFEKPVRPQLLAAIVRLADELSEAPYRANQVGIALKELPTGSQAYHYYAFGLHSTEIDAGTRSIRLKFWYSEDWFLSAIPKDDGQIYLLDYIFSRTIKTYDEALYCTKYMHGSLFFDKVHVAIDIFSEKTKLPMKRIAYTLKQHGFPKRLPAEEDIYVLAPELSSFEGRGRLTASLLALALGGA